MGEQFAQQAWRTLLRLDQSEHMGLQVQLRKFFSSAIADGHLTPLTPMPSSRSLSSMLAISRTQFFELTSSSWKMDIW